MDRFIGQLVKSIMVDEKKIRKAAKLASDEDWDSAFNFLEGRMDLPTEYDKIKTRVYLARWLYAYSEFKK